MPRKMRVQYPGAMYHPPSPGYGRTGVMSRGGPPSPRLRRETTLSVKRIAERLQLGKPKGARTNLHKFMNSSETGGPQTQLDFQ
jgi:hypothetical protein